ncbi:MAG TPA: serine hydrolase domain-containing protein, partial [Thermoanaerobaculia bacterium]|nr:serine hydrolase domain-containing protein [Thermoanaerobaculia bacterium]
VLDTWLAARVAERELPSVAIGIVHDQDVVWSKAYGFADVAKKAPATTKTGYRIASLSKTFTATAILQLRDAGKLQLDDPVAKHLAWFTPKNAHPGEPVITIRHLLTHTSGLPRESAASWYWNDMVFPTREEMIAALAKQETVFPAETQYKYSNLALAIAGDVVERLSGERYADYLTRHVLAPLGMNDTHVIPTPDLPGLAVGYGRRVPGKLRAISKFTDLKGLAACGNLSSTVDDLAKWVAFQMRDEGPPAPDAVLKPSTLREMHRVHWLQSSWKSGRGLGFSVRRVEDEVRYGHGGAVSGHKTSFEVAPASKVAVIVLTNEDDGRPGEIRDMVFKLVEPALKKAGEEKEPAKPKGDWSRFAGTYEWEGDEVHVMLLDGELALVDTSDDDPWEERIRLAPVSASSFRMKGGGTEGELVVFELDEKGNVRRMTAGDSYYIPKR